MLAGVLAGVLAAQDRSTDPHIELGCAVPRRGLPPYSDLNLISGASGFEGRVRRAEEQSVTPPSRSMHIPPGQPLFDPRHVTLRNAIPQGQVLLRIRRCSNCPDRCFIKFGSGAPANVLNLCHKLQVVGVNAGPYATEVIHLSIGGDRTKGSFVIVPMCVDLLSVGITHHAVAQWHHAQLPDPARGVKASSTIR